MRESSAGGPVGGIPELHERIESTFNRRRPDQRHRIPQLDLHHVLASSKVSTPHDRPIVNYRLPSTELDRGVASRDRNINGPDERVASEVVPDVPNATDYAEPACGQVVLVDELPRPRHHIPRQPIRR